MKRLLLLLYIISIGVASSHAVYYHALMPVKPTVWHWPDSAQSCPSYCDTIATPSAYTMIMVYQTHFLDTALQLWKLRRTDSVFYSFNTHGLTTEHSNSEIAPSSANTSPCIYTAQHNIPIDSTYHSIYRLFTGEDSVHNDSTTILLFESAYFDKRLAPPQLLMFQTYLALKYGIMLDKAHYISTMGDTIWNAKTDEKYYNRIQGIGSDSVYNFYALKSIALGDSILCITTTDTLPLNAYLVLGDNNAGVGWSACDSRTNILQRTWKMRATDSIPHIGLQLNRTHLSATADSIKLAVLSPDSIIIRIICPYHIDSVNNYYDLSAPSGQMLFSFVTIQPELRSRHRNRAQQNIIPKQEALHTDNETGDMRFVLSPNPTHDRFVLEVSFPQHMSVNVVVRDAAGKVLNRKALTNITHYQYRGSIPCSGLYFVSVYNNQDGKLLTTKELLVH